MNVIHALFSDSSGCIYCKKINGLIQIVPLKTPCLQCEKFRGTIQGEGCECEWDDFDFSEDVAVYDHIAEYDRVNDFKSVPKEQRLTRWKIANDTARMNNQAPRVNVWTLVQRLADIIRSDDCDTLSYMDKEISFDGISGEDSYEFCAKQAEYRKWLSEFEEVVG